MCVFSLIDRGLPFRKWINLFPSQSGWQQGFGEHSEFNHSPLEAGNLDQMSHKSLQMALGRKIEPSKPPPHPSGLWAINGWSNKHANSSRRPSLRSKLRVASSSHARCYALLCTLWFMLSALFGLWFTTSGKMDCDTKWWFAKIGFAVDKAVSFISSKLIWFDILKCCWLYNLKVIWQLQTKLLISSFHLFLKMF